MDVQITWNEHFDRMEDTHLVKLEFGSQMEKKFRKPEVKTESHSTT